MVAPLIDLADLRDSFAQMLQNRRQQRATPAARYGQGAGILAQLGVGSVVAPQLAAYDAGPALQARGTYYGVLAVTATGAGPFSNSVNATFSIAPGSYLWIRPRGAISADLVDVTINGRNVPSSFAGAILPGDFLEVGGFHATGFFVPDGVPAQATLSVTLNFSGAGTVDVVFRGQSDDAVRAMLLAAKGCR